MFAHVCTWNACLFHRALFFVLFLVFFPLIFKRYIILQLLLHVAEYNSRNSDSSLPPGIYFLQKGGGVK